MANTVKDLVANLKDTIAKLEKMDQDTAITQCSVWTSSERGTKESSMNVLGVEIYASCEEDDDDAFFEFGVILSC